ncbi:MAG: MmgE/PrpD family protein, partial [Burkholderiales bacterium]
MTTTRLTEILRRPIDAATRERAALHVLDWLGCALVGATTEPGIALRRWSAREEPGTGPCTIVLGGRGTLWTALVANGGVGNILEMDDIHRTAILHPGPVIVPAALALAERENASSAAFLNAVIRGYEAAIRIGRSLGPAHYRYWHNTATGGVFGAAAAAGSLLNLPVAQMVDALGNAGTQASGLWQVRLEPVMGKQLHNGRAAHAGVLAADLAQHGFTGAQAILEGPLGFFNAMCPDGKIERVTAGSDAPWLIYETGFKPWPACRHAHPTIDAALALAGGVYADDIDTVEIRSYKDAVTICDRVHPSTAVDAKFSLQHSAAVVFLRGKPSLGDYEPATFNEPRFRAFRKRVKLTLAEPYASRFPAHFGAEITIRLKTGE